jgi:hypothetical protein
MRTIPKPSPPPYGSDLTLEDLIRSSIARGRPRHHDRYHHPPALPVAVNGPARSLASRNLSARRGSEQGEAVVLAAGSAAARRPPPPPLDSDRRPTFAGHYNDALRRSLRQVLESVLDELEDSVIPDGDGDGDDDALSLGWRNGTAVRRHSNGAECRTTTSTADSNIIRSEESETDREDRDEVADDAMGD